MRRRARSSTPTFRHRAASRRAERAFPWASGRSSAIMPCMEPAPLRLTFDGGTLVVAGATPEYLATLPGCRPDPRSGGFRAEARWYRPLVEHLRQQRVPYKDDARAWQPTP